MIRIDTAINLETETGIGIDDGMTIGAVAIGRMIDIIVDITRKETVIVTGTGTESAIEIVIEMVDEPTGLLHDQPLMIVVGLLDIPMKHR